MTITDKLIRKDRNTTDNSKGASSPRRSREPLFVPSSGERSFGLSVLFSTLKMVVFAGCAACFLGLGMVVGVAKAYIETAPEIDISQLTISDRTSFIYDKNGTLITSIAATEYRDWTDIEDIPEILQHAFVAVEDVRFYKHSGVDVKRLFSAALEILGNSNSSGGSTITQQLVKNKILGSQRNYKRKVQEAYLALILEQTISKEEILEAYLNDIYLGESNYGVATAAKDYFGKSLSQLTIRECAMLAGLTQSPYYYNPRLNTYVRNRMEVTDKRTDTVLSRMYRAGYITKEEYNAAKADHVTIIETSEQTKMYDMAYFVEYAVEDVITHLLSQRGLPDTEDNRHAVEKELRTGGYHIYTTVDPDIQSTVQNTLSDWDGYPVLADSSKSVREETLASGAVLTIKEPQAAAVVLDYKTGELRAIVGGREEPQVRRGLNRAYQSYMEVGSSIKPLTVYGPALDLGYAPATIVANMDGRINGWNTETGYPSGGLDRRYGPVTIRRGIMSSLNVVAARVLMDKVGVDTAAQYLVNLGASPSRINADGSGLALGTSGLTPIQMAGAYGAIASGGIYREPLSFTKVLDSDGKVILDADNIRITRQVYKKTTAYLLTDMLMDAVESGTGTKAQIKGMTVAGKTGTNSDYASVYFAGYTPYYVSTLWIGHDYPANKLKAGADGGAYAAPLWQSYMSKIHNGLLDRDIIGSDPSSMGLVKCTVCSVSGELASSVCSRDPDHKPVSDWFVQGTAPTSYCSMHAEIEVCESTGDLATDFCPESGITVKNIVLINSRSDYAAFDDDVLAEGIPNFVRSDLSPSEYLRQMSTCSRHSDSSLSVFGLKSEAEQLLAEAYALLDEDYRLADDEVFMLRNAVNSMESAILDYSYNEIEESMEHLSSVMDLIG